MGCDGMTGAAAHSESAHAGVDGASANADTTVKVHAQNGQCETETPARSSVVEWASCRTSMWSPAPAAFEEGSPRSADWRRQILLGLCTAALVVCVLAWEHRVAGADGVASVSLLSESQQAFGTADSEGVAGNILEAARQKYAAEKRLQAKHAQAVLQNNRPKEAASRAAASEESSSVSSLVKGGKHKAESLEQKIAEHKLSTRDLVKASLQRRLSILVLLRLHPLLLTTSACAVVRLQVQEKQKEEEQAMGQGLRDQTDDLIVERIKQLRGKQDSSKADGASAGGGGKNTIKYVLSNALTKEEQKQLASNTAAGQSDALPSSQGGGGGGGGAAEGGKADARAGAPPMMSQLRETPPAEEASAPG
eukprot:3295150-Rhodomonas_salina.1